MAKLKNVVFKTNKIDEFKLKCSQFFLYLCMIFFAINILINVTYSVAPVSGMSMYPTLNYGFYNGNGWIQDRVVLNYIKNYQKGDIIVAKKTFDDSGEEYMYVIKRLIAVGGDRVKVFENGDVYVNDELLIENYVNDNKHITYYNIQNLKKYKPELFKDDELIIPKDCVFYLGDNRGGSSDCSCYGPVSKNEIVAKVDYLIKGGENLFLSILKQIFNGGKLWLLQNKEQNLKKLLNL